jgi:Flp pilus assembly protein TadD
LTGSGEPGGRGRVRLWDSATGRPLGLDLPLPMAVVSVAFSPDGERFVFGGGTLILGAGAAQVFDVATGKAVSPPLPHGLTVMAVAYSPDGATVLTGSLGDSARLWDVATGKELRTFRHQGGVVAVAFSRDGKRILTGSRDKTARVWDVETGRTVGEAFRHPDEVIGVAFSPDGRTALTGCLDNTARLWDVPTGRSIGVPFRHQSWVRAVAFSPDGETVVTGSGDNTAQCWDRATREPISGPLRHQSWVIAAAFSPDGKTVLTGSKDLTARLWPMPVPVEGEVERIRLWAQVLTGARLEEDESVHTLDASAWRDCLRRFQEVGGSPLPPETEQADPTLVDTDATLWHQQQAEAAWRDRQWFAAVFHLNRFLAATPGQAPVHERCGLAYCGLGQPQKAAVEFSRALELQPGECLFAFEQAGALALTGDAEGYRRACVHLLERFGQSKDPWTAYSVARACLLTPQTPADLSRLEQLAARAVPAFPDCGWSLHTLGLASYRAGRFDEAVRRFHQSMHADPKWVAQSANWLALALAYHRLGKRAEAKHWQDKADQRAAPTGGGTPSQGAGDHPPGDLYRLHPHDILACQLLRRELEGLVKEPNP